MMGNRKSLNDTPFNIVKTVTIFICCCIGLSPNYDYKNDVLKVNINILEAVIEAHRHYQYQNAFKGILLILMLSIIEKQKVMNDY